MRLDDGVKPWVHILVGEAGRLVSVSIRFERLRTRQGNALGPFKEFTAFVVAGKEDLDRLYPLGADRPRFDLRREFLIEVYRGECPTGGYRIHVKTVEQEGQNVTVTVTLENPGPGEVVTMVITYPFEIVKIQRRSLAQGGDLHFSFIDEGRNALRTLKARVTRR